MAIDEEEPLVAGGAHPKAAYGAGGAPRKAAYGAVGGIARPVRRGSGRLVAGLVFASLGLAALVGLAVKRAELAPPRARLVESDGQSFVELQASLDEFQKELAEAFPEDLVKDWEEAAEEIQAAWGAVIPGVCPDGDEGHVCVPTDHDEWQKNWDDAFAGASDDAEGAEAFAAWDAHFADIEGSMDTALTGIFSGLGPTSWIAQRFDSLDAQIAWLRELVEGLYYVNGAAVPEPGIHTIIPGPRAGPGWTELPSPNEQKAAGFREYPDSVCPMDGRYKGLNKHYVCCPAWKNRDKNLPAQIRALYESSSSSSEVSSSSSEAPDVSGSGGRSSTRLLASDWREPELCGRETWRLGEWTEAERMCCSEWLDPDLDWTRDALAYGFIRPPCPDRCSGKGWCDSHGECDCFSGFHGDGCGLIGESASSEESSSSEDEDEDDK